MAEVEFLLLGGREKVEELLVHRTETQHLVSTRFIVMRFRKPKARGEVTTIPPPFTYLLIYYTVCQ